MWCQNDIMVDLPKWLIQVHYHANVVLSFCTFQYLLEHYGKTNATFRLNRKQLLHSGFSVFLPPQQIFGNMLLVLKFHVKHNKYQTCFQRNFLSFSPVMTASSLKFFLQEALAASIPRFSLLMKYCESLYMSQPSSVVLYTVKGTKQV